MYFQTGAAMNNGKIMSGDKIRVFISSACGGERIKFDRFVDNESRNKQDVVNKALVTNYDLVRRALKVAFDETGFIETYVFEDSSGSSSTAEEDFLYEIKNSDICLF